MTDDLKHLIGNPDADAWAKAFIKTYNNSEHRIVIDVDFMRTWFANAMMAMHDHIMSKSVTAAMKKINEDVDKELATKLGQRVFKEIGGPTIVSTTAYKDSEGYDMLVQSFEDGTIMMGRVSWNAGYPQVTWKGVKQV